MNNADLQIKINSEVRKNALRKLETMEWALTIPPADYQVLMLLLPELQSKDAQVRDQAWRAFIKSDLSEPYRVRRHRSKMVMNNGKTEKISGD